MKDKLNIFFTIDKSYLQHFTVTLTSILENNKHLSIRVFVINDLKNLSDLNKISKFFEDNYEITLEVLSIESNEFNKVKIDHHISEATHHISNAAYFRLLLTEIIPKDISCGLFIDSDTIVTGSLSFFAEIDFEDDNKSVSLFAVEQDTKDDVKRLNSLGFATQHYFNAGVMYINLKYWRSKNACLHLTEIAEKFKGELIWHDQDVLNMFFYADWKQVPYIYNSFGILGNKLNKLPIIIHYTGYPKPWGYNKIHPYREFYFKYLKLTPYKKYSPFAHAIGRRIKGLIERFS